MRSTYLMITILLFACEDRIDQPIFSTDTDLIVVEANFTNESKSQLVKLTRTYREPNDVPAAVSGATVLVVEGSDSFFPLTETPPGSGEYFTTEMIAVFGRVYTLVIRYQGADFIAQARSVPVEPMTPLSYEKADDGQYRLILNESGTEANFVEHRLSWSNTPTCSPDDACSGLVIYYDLKTIDVHELFKPAKTDFTFPVNAQVIRRKYSVSPEHRNFLRSVLSESEWRGGIFDVQRSNAGGNVRGALGFFAISTVQADTTIIVEKP